MTNPNDPAFPCIESRESCTIERGLTKREEFAKAALQGLLSDRKTIDEAVRMAARHKTGIEKVFAVMAVSYASALIAELNK